MKAVAPVLLAVLVWPLAAQEAATPLFKPADLRPAERIVLDLAAAGRPKDAKELRGLLESAGYPKKSLDAIDKRLSKVKPPKRDSSKKWPRIAKSLARVVKRLADQFKTITDPVQKKRAAEFVLCLDHSIEAAHLALGRSKQNGVWVTPEDRKLAPRQTEVFARMQEARRLNPKVEVAESKHELLLHVLGKGGHVVSCNGITVHSHWPVGKVSRMLQNLVRGFAFSKWLVDGGEIRLPAPIRHTSILFTGKQEYSKAAKWDLAKGKTTEKNYARVAAYYRLDDSMVHGRMTETYTLAGLFTVITGVTNGMLHSKTRHPTLVVGHANWVLMAMFGTKMPAITFVEKNASKGTATKHEVELRMLFGAGLMGARSWLRYKVGLGEDPPWSRSFLDQVGKIQGVDMLKTSFIAEYLHLLGPLGPILEKSKEGVGKSTPEIAKSLATALGAELHEFESRWRSWMRGVPGGTDSLIGRLGGQTKSLSKVERQVLDELAKVRKPALVHPLLAQIPPVTIDRVLSRQALAHATYLNRHPDQTAKWPDAHEEYTDRDGFTPEGCWAGMHSVIAPGTKTVKNAMDAWMGTYFHRLPLLEPGLFRVGYGQDKAVAVLDSGSMVRDLDISYHVHWPPDHARDIPRSFRPELPNPYPGEDQSKWGYPITLQIGERTEGGSPNVTMELREGGAVVDCLLSSPQNPGNPLLVPKLTWCLIPKRTLKGGTRYHVRIVIEEKEPKTIEFSFSTGRK